MSSNGLRPGHGSFGAELLRDIFRFCTCCTRFEAQYGRFCPDGRSDEAREEVVELIETHCNGIVSEAFDIDRVGELNCARVVTDSSFA